MNRHSTIGFHLDSFAADLLRSAPRFQDLLRRMDFQPQGRTRLLAPPFLACASDAIPFRKGAVAEPAGIYGGKGAQRFRPPLPDCACETPFAEAKRVRPA